MSKKCGYSFWGFLGDVKYDKNHNMLSTPDGNAFYSWCIIRELQKRGFEVTQIMPDRDKYGREYAGYDLFKSWHCEERTNAYCGTKKLDWDSMFGMIKAAGDSGMITDVRTKVMDFLDMACHDLKFILHEYRMEIPGRNDLVSMEKEGWQPDYLIQECLFEYCALHGKKLIIFDLDYKLTEEECKELGDMWLDFTVLELGNKWSGIENVKSRKVYIPFDFEIPMPIINRDKPNNLVYVGNRYERDWCIDKYIPEDLEKCTVYGNWLESNRDSKDRWPNITFGKRLQTRDMLDVYGSSVATILLAKREYCENGFMTARIIESIFYGSVPFFIEEYGEDVIKEYAGTWAWFLTVSSKEELKQKIEKLRKDDDGLWIINIIQYLRDQLKFMDVTHFVDILMEEV